MPYKVVGLESSDRLILSQPDAIDECDGAPCCFFKDNKNMWIDSAHRCTSGNAHGHVGCILDLAEILIEGRF